MVDALHALVIARTWISEALWHVGGIGAVVKVVDSHLCEWGSISGKSCSFLISLYFIYSDQHIKYWMLCGFPLTSSLLLDYHVKQYITHTLLSATFYLQNLVLWSIHPLADLLWPLLIIYFMFLLQLMSIWCRLNHLWHQWLITLPAAMISPVFNWSLLKFLHTLRLTGETRVVDI